MRTVYFYLKGGRTMSKRFGLLRIASVLMIGLLLLAACDAGPVATPSPIAGPAPAATPADAAGATSPVATAASAATTAVSPASAGPPLKNPDTLVESSVGELA